MVFSDEMGCGKIGVTIYILYRESVILEGDPLEPPKVAAGQTKLRGGSLAVGSYTFKEAVPPPPPRLLGKLCYG